MMGPTSKGRWSYACSKAIDEFLGLAYHKEKRLPVVVARLFNTVGPRQTGRYGMVVPNFVKQALLGHPLTVFGDGTPDAVLHLRDRRGGAAHRPRGGAAGGGRGLEHRERPRGGHDPRSRAAGGGRAPRSKSAIELVPYDRAYEEGFEDMQRRVPDLSKLRALTGYEPKVHLDEILDRVVAYFTSDATRL